MIAMVISSHPKLLIADEPITALDVTVQAQILKLLRDLQAELGMAVLIITHDLGVVAQFADRVAVMYAGDIVENAETAELFERPLHPYTVGLLRSIPSMDHDTHELQAIEGSVPDLADMPSGCRFGPRCADAQTRCFGRSPPLRPVTADHS